MFKVTFSDGRTINISASTEAEATRKAYRVEPVYTVSAVVPA